VRVCRRRVPEILEVDEASESAPLDCYTKGETPKGHFLETLTLKRKVMFEHVVRVETVGVSGGRERGTSV
jgi:hypothetical protein